MRKARLIAPLPPERFEAVGGSGNAPIVGDIVELDQGFTFPDGRQGGMVYCVATDGAIIWTADVYDSEIEALPDDDVPRQ
jgi:hypothetical protein